MLLETAKEVVRISEELERQKRFEQDVKHHSLMSLDLVGNAWEVGRPNIHYLEDLKKQFSGCVLYKIDEEIKRLEKELADL